MANEPEPLTFGSLGPTVPHRVRFTDSGNDPASAYAQALHIRPGRVQGALAGRRGYGRLGDAHKGDTDRLDALAPAHSPRRGPGEPESRAKNGTFAQGLPGNLFNPAGYKGLMHDQMQRALGARPGADEMGSRPAGMVAARNGAAGKTASCTAGLSGALMDAWKPMPKVDTKR